MLLTWQKLWIMLTALGICLSAPALPAVDAASGAAAVARSSVLQTADGPVSVVESERVTQSAVTFLRGYVLPNGDSVRMGSARAARNLETVCVERISLPAAKGTIRWYDATAKGWKTTPLADALVCASCVCVTTEAGEVLLYTPKVYESLGSATLRRDADSAGSVRITVSGGVCTVELLASSIPIGHTAEYMLVQSEQALFHWDRDGAAWEACTMDNDRLWCYDGCYHPSPGSYTPTGDNCFYRIPAAYFCRLVGENAPEIRAASDLLTAMLDVVSRQQNEAGYFPTVPTSQWLSSAYGIGGGFYDSRFNSDLMEIYCQAHDWLGCASFDETVNRYFDFYLAMARQSALPTANGILVPDYCGPTGGEPSHTSLNHQLAEIMALYHWADRSGREELRLLADQMLQGVEDVGDGWIRPDGDLYYSIQPDGSFSGTDYPYLTYNDLFQARAYLRGGGRDTSTLQRLMDAKLRWMRANGVTGYLS